MFNTFIYSIIPRRHASNGSFTCSRFKRKRSTELTKHQARALSAGVRERERKKTDWDVDKRFHGAFQINRPIFNTRESSSRFKRRTREFFKVQTKLSSTKRQELKMRNSTFLSTVIIIIVLSQCFQANAWRRRRRRRSPVIKPQPPKFVPAPRNPSGIPLCKGQIDVNQILQRGASGRKKRGVKRQVSVLETIYWPHLRGLMTWARLARLARLTRVTNIFSRPQKKIWINLRILLHLN